MTIHRIKCAIVGDALEVAPISGCVVLTMDGGRWLTRPDRGQHVLSPEETAALIFALEQSLEELDTRAARGFVPA